MKDSTERHGEIRAKGVRYVETVRETTFDATAARNSRILVCSILSGLGTKGAKLVSGDTGMLEWVPPCHIVPPQHRLLGCRKRR